MTNFVPPAMAPGEWHEAFAVLNRAELQRAVEIAREELAKPSERSHEELAHKLAAVFNAAMPQRSARKLTWDTVDRIVDAAEKLDESPHADELREEADRIAALLPPRDQRDPRIRRADDNASVASIELGGYAARIDPVPKPDGRYIGHVDLDGSDALIYGKTSSELVDALRELLRDRAQRR